MGIIKRDSKRIWITKPPVLNSISYLVTLNTWDQYVLKEGKVIPKEGHYNWLEYYDKKETVDQCAELTFSIGSNIIKIHSPDFFETPKANLENYIEKLNIMISVIDDFINAYGDKPKETRRYGIKRFLNPDEGDTSTYTSVFSIGTNNGSFYFDISSCNYKGRMYFDTEVEFLRAINKVRLFITDLIKVVRNTLEHPKLNISVE